MNRLRTPLNRSGLDRDAFQVLGLLEDPDSYDVQAVDSRWRDLRSQLHPDRPGGDAAKFDQARKAYDAARHYVLQPKPCPDCGGTGKREVVRANDGFGVGTMTLNCKTCKGRGTL